MNNTPILIVDDDKDDLEFFQQAFTELEVENQILVFSEADEFLQYIQHTTDKTFFILCDINMSKRSGLELRKIVFDDHRLRLQCIPFIFLSTSTSSRSVMEVYSFGVQGYFIKQNSLKAMKELLRNTMNYWNASLVPTCI